MEQCTPLEAAHHLADRFSIEIPTKLLTEMADHKPAQDHYFAICKAVALWCHEQLKKNPTLLRYLEERKFTTESINNFSIGYFPGGPASINLFTHAMRSAGFLTNELLEAHILAQGKTVAYSPFEERLIFPIKDHLGRFCGFGGRIFKPHDERAKYYNSQENDFFIKGSLLFGLDRAKRAIQESATVFLVEGYTDCIAMVQNGFPNTVATLGTACTPIHLKTLSRYAQKLYLLYDSDTAGEQAIIRIAKLCWLVDLELMVINLPEKQDPASFFKDNHSIQPYIDQARDIFVFFIDSLGKEFTTKLMPEKVRLTRQFIDLIRTLDDSLKQDFLLQKAAKTFDIPFQTLKSELTRVENISQPADKLEAELAEKPEAIEATLLEKRIFCAILNDMQLLNNYNGKYLISYMPPPLKTILQQLHAAQKIDPSIDFLNFYNLLNPEEQQLVSYVLLEHEEKIESTEFSHLLLQLQRKYWKIIVKDIKDQLTQAKNSGDSTRATEILQEFMILKQTVMPIVDPEQSNNSN
jgi:DNA primase